MIEGQMDVWVTGWMAHSEGVWDLYLLTVSVFLKDGNHVHLQNNVACRGNKKGKFRRPGPKPHHC